MTRGPSYRKTWRYKLRQILWPRMGWVRYLKYIRHKLLRLKDTTKSIALGMSCGAAISFVPLPGTHMIGAALLSIFIRGNVFASAIGTLVGNPWTFPLMWWLSYKLGECMFRTFGLNMSELPEHFSFSQLKDEILTDPFSLLVPWISGGIVMMAISFPVFFTIFYYFVRNWRMSHRPDHTQKARGQR